MKTNLALIYHTPIGYSIEYLTDWNYLLRAIQISENSLSKCSQSNETIDEFWPTHNLYNAKANHWGFVQLRNSRFASLVSNGEREREREVDR